MHIKDKLAEAHRSGKPVFSFEFFPPKTAQVSLFLLLCPLRFSADLAKGVQNLYDRKTIKRKDRCGGVTES